MIVRPLASRTRKGGRAARKGTWEAGFSRSPTLLTTATNVRTRFLTCSHEPNAGWAEKLFARSRTRSSLASSGGSEIAGVGVARGGLSTGGAGVAGAAFGAGREK